MDQEMSEERQLVLTQEEGPPANRENGEKATAETYEHAQARCSPAGRARYSQEGSWPEALASRLALKWREGSFHLSSNFSHSYFQEFGIIFHNETTFTS